MSYAKVVVVGNLGRDPETRYTPNGTMNVSFSVATNRRFTDSSGQQQERATWFRCTAWGKLAEVADGLAQSGALAKGRQVLVDGRIELNEYTSQDGEKRASLEVTANEIQLLGANPNANGSTQRPQRDTAAAARQSVQSTEAEEFDDVPF